METPKPPFFDLPVCGPEARQQLRAAWLRGFVSGALCFAAVVLGAFLGTVAALLLL